MPKGHIRKLFYHPDKQRLFFTTTLQNAVQSFSLQKFELLDAAPNHPSPPTVFAVSPACDLLVSASTDPPTIYLSRITCKQPPLLFIPSCSNAPVVSVCFHPSRANVFALGFQDGTIAAYNASILPFSEMTEERFSYAKIYGEISHLTRLHNYQNDASTSAKSPLSEYKSATSMPTVSGMQFIKHRACSVASVGSDRNCFIVDFQSNGRRVAKVIQNWNLQAAATSLAILSINDDLAQIDGPSNDVETDDVLLAIGKDDGTVSIYEQIGRLLATRDFSKDGRILDLEWMQRSRNESQPKLDQQRSSVKLQSTIPQANQPEVSSKIPSSSSRLSSKSSPSPIGSRIMVKLHVKDPPPDDYLLREKSPTQHTDEHPDQSASSPNGNAISLPEKNPIDGPWQDIVPKENQNTDSGIKAEARNDNVSNTKFEGSSTSHRRRSRQSSRTTIRSSGSSVSSKKIKKPVVPPRPISRPGGKLALRRVESAKLRRTSNASQSPVPNEVVHAVTTGQPQFNNINHEPLARPSMHARHRSSKVSPLTEATEPHFRKTSSIPSSPLANTPITPKSPTTPVQYNRLTRSLWDADSGSSSMSRTSVYYDSNAKYNSEPLARTSRPVIKKGAASLPQAKLVERDVVSPGTMSDSGNSASSILDWTPSQVQRPTYIPYSRVVSRNLRAMPESASVPHNHRRAAEHFHNQDSDIAPGTIHFDWQNKHNPTEAKDFEILNPATGEPENSPTSEKTEQPTKTRFSTSLPYIAPLNNPKLRKQQTVIHLKDKPEKPTNTQSEKTASPTAKATAADAADAKTPEPRKSDPGPSILHPPNATTILTREETTLQLPPPQRSPPSIPRSSNARRFSQLKGIMSLPQIRSGGGSTAASQSMYTLEDVIRIECAAVCTHVDVGFQEHKGWLLGFMKEQNWYVQRLEEENRLFREELARLRRGGCC